MNRSEYLKKRRTERKEFAITRLGGKCVQCGVDTALEFDHIDRRTKTKPIASCFHLSLEKLIVELDKCQLLCRPCHIEKSSKERFGRPSKSPEHGSHTAYQKGCRCTECIEFNKEYRRLYYKKNGWYKRESTGHGTSYSYYSKKCRCEACIEAWKVAKEKASIRTKERRSLRK
jgi:hypothetical protein